MTGNRAGMTDDKTHRPQGQAEEPPAPHEGRRPDLQAAPESPPADQQEVDRGREKLDRVLAK
jgi:hypothetical protein